MSLRNITVSDHFIRIRFGDLKQTRPGHQLKDIAIKAYAVDRRLCPCSTGTMQEYLERTEGSRSDDALYISWINPHNAVPDGTLSRWSKLVLKAAGVDLKQFTAHNIRKAATSAAAKMNVLISSILSTAG